MRDHPVLQKTAAVLLGLAAAFGLLEAGLRVAAHLYVSATAPEAGAAGLRNGVLCVGDSFTYGSGAPVGSSYPAQLESLLRARGMEDVRVVNAGICAANTWIAGCRLQEALEAGRPRLVVVLAGGANAWNLYGFNRYAGGGLRAAARDWACRLRVVKVALLLRRNASRLTLQPERSGRYPLLSDSAAARAARPPSGGPEDCFRQGEACLARGDLEGAAGCFARSLEREPGAFARSMEALMDCLQRLDRPLDMVGVLEKVSPRCPPALRGQLYEFMATAYGHAGRARERTEAVLRGIRESPDYRNLYDLVADQALSDEALRLRLVGALREAAPRSETAREFFEYWSRLDPERFEARLECWVRGDLAWMIESCRSRGVRVLLQNYPRLDPEAADEAGVWLQTTAARYGVPFVDQRADFGRLDEEARRALFVPGDEHCNAQGYGRMARNLADAIGRLGLLDPEAARETGKN